MMHDYLLLLLLFPLLRSKFARYLSSQERKHEPNVRLVDKQLRITFNKGTSTCRNIFDIIVLRDIVITSLDIYMDRRLQVEVYM